jgi:hypothetical protein
VSTPWTNIVATTYVAVILIPVGLLHASSINTGGARRPSAAIGLAVSPTAPRPGPPQMGRGHIVQPGRTQAVGRLIALGARDS